MTVTFLTTGIWPSYKMFGINLPSEMVKCVEVFKEFYEKKTKDPATETVSRTDVSEFNSKFTASMCRIKIPLRHVDDRKKFIENVDKDCRYAIDAAIVKIRKGKKALGHQQLVSDCAGKLSQMFKPDIKTIKICIEDLITRDYLERDMENPNMFSIGSLGVHNSQACVSNITVRNTVIRDSDNGLRVKTWQGGTGSVSNLLFENIQMENVLNCIIVDQYYCQSKDCRNETSAVRVFDVQYRNIKGTYDVRSAPIHFACSDTVACTNITMSEVELLPEEGELVDDPFCWNAYGTQETLTIPPIDCLLDGSPVVEEGIGSLGVHNSQACVSNITVRNTVIRDSDNGLRVKTWQGGTGSVSNLLFENIEMENVLNCIIVDQYYCQSKDCRNETSAVRVFDVQYRNIKGTYDVRSAPIHFACSDTVACTNITMSEVELLPEEGELVDDPFCWNAYGTQETLTIPPIDCLLDGSPVVVEGYNSNPGC
ncbi:hypothetical protein DY000_02058813 [Brassica cretica]|uniref:Cullin family profile domain-containing protein n=1 Tax=Brassica cretica TaxID=69181 RepID=A0ABQ7AW25_BRACR|nr:hypothetical protein DY000_02058813 [Brassica cretica]